MFLFWFIYDSHSLGWTEHYQFSIIFDSLVRDSNRMNEEELTYLSYWALPCISSLLFSGASIWPYICLIPSFVHYNCCVYHICLYNSFLGLWFDILGLVIAHEILFFFSSVRHWGSNPLVNTSEELLSDLLSEISIEMFLLYPGVAGKPQILVSQGYQDLVFPVQSLEMGIPLPW